MPMHEREDHDDLCPLNFMGDNNKEKQRDLERNTEEKGSETGPGPSKTHHLTLKEIWQVGYMMAQQLQVAASAACTCGPQGSSQKRRK